MTRSESPRSRSGYRYYSRAWQMLVAIAALAVGTLGCTTPTEPLPAGTIVLSAVVPEQAVLIDDRGDHIQMEEVRLRIESVRLSRTTSGGCTDAICVNGDGVPAQGIAIRDGEGATIASWSDVPDDAERLLVRIAPATEGDAALPAGSSTGIGGIYNGILADRTQFYGAFLGFLPWTLELDLSLPDRLNVEEQGARLALVLDPSMWVLDPESGHLLAIEHLVGRVDDPTSPDAARLKALFESSVHLEMR